VFFVSLQLAKYGCSRSCTIDAEAERRLSDRMNDTELSPWRLNGIG
jgi:hypothetical protein